MTEPTPPAAMQVTNPLQWQIMQAQAALMFTGVSVDGQPLPRWLMVNTDDQLRAAAKLVDDMTQLAISRATAMRGAPDAN